MTKIPPAPNEDVIMFRLSMFAIISLALFFVFLLIGSGFQSSFFGALFWAGVILWYINKESVAGAEQDAADSKQNALRDADAQDSPYHYQIGRHANETLALRYGLVNAKGNKEADTIQLRKLKKIKTDFYKVELPTFGKRNAIAVIEPGTDYVKTFYPTEEDWFTTHAKLETLLKNNGGLGLSDIAKYHIEAALKS